MDLNYLLLRHQHSLHAARIATSPEARHAHRGLAAGYAARAGAARTGIAAAPAPLPADAA